MKAERRKGMSLVEIMVALLIATIAFAGIAMAVSTGLLSIRTSREQSLAVELAQQEIEETRNLGFGGILSRSFPATGLNGTGNLNVQNDPTDPTHFKKVTATVSWTTASGRIASVVLVTRMTDNGINRK